MIRSGGRAVDDTRVVRVAELPTWWKTRPSCGPLMSAMRLFEAVTTGRSGGEGFVVTPSNESQPDAFLTRLCGTKESSRDQWQWATEEDNE